MKNLRGKEKDWEGRGQELNQAAGCHIPDMERTWLEGDCGIDEGTGG